MPRRVKTILESVFRSRGRVVKQRRPSGSGHAGALPKSRMTLFIFFLRSRPSGAATGARHTLFAGSRVRFNRFDGGPKSEKSHSIRFDVLLPLSLASEDVFFHCGMRVIIIYFFFLV